MIARSLNNVRVIVLFLLSIAVAEIANAQTVNVWLTTDDQSTELQQQPSVTFAPGSSGNNPVFVDETQTYQQVEGFGADFTDSAAYLLNEVATPAARSNAMNNLFTRSGGGIGVSFVRNPMGASDLARSEYSYDDLAAGQIDTNLTLFSIAHDQVDIIPLVRQALQLNPQLTIMANPWSPPGWMKDSGSMVGGSLLPAMYTPFANYFVKYIQAYQAAGIPIRYISLQNEPLYAPGDYPGMYMDAPTQLSVLRDYVLRLWHRIVFPPGYWSMTTIGISQVIRKRSLPTPTCWLRVRSRALPGTDMAARPARCLRWPTCIPRREITRPSTPAARGSAIRSRPISRRSYM